MSHARSRHHEPTNKETTMERLSPEQTATAQRLLRSKNLSQEQLAMVHDLLNPKLERTSNITPEEVSIAHGLR